MNGLAVDGSGTSLLASPFTWMAGTREGNRRASGEAARPGAAVPPNGFMRARLDAWTGGRVATGVFGAAMQVHPGNDGPVTIRIDSRCRD
jgi:D-tyrosyl-tRNA(Tyr) deacylase